MIRNKIRRNRATELAYTVSRLFAKYDIDLDLVDAGVSCLKSLAQAKRRTKERLDYIAKGIQFNFNKTDRFALLEVIQGDKEFWQAWIKQHEIFERTGLEADRPTIHRLNPNGHYEFGNIGVLSSGEHQQEHAESMALVTLENGNLSARIFGSKTATATAIGVGIDKVNNMAKRSYKVIDKATGADTGQLAITMPVKVLEPTNNEEEYKAQCKAEGIIYDAPEVRAERDKRMVASILEKHRS